MEVILINENNTSDFLPRSRGMPTRCKRRAQMPFDSNEGGLGEKTGMDGARRWIAAG